MVVSVKYIILKTIHAEKFEFSSALKIELSEMMTVIRYVKI